MGNSVVSKVDDNGVHTITLNRPDVHNAFDNEVIKELIVELEFIEDDSSARALVLTGTGKTFSSGADINWMREMVNYDHETNCLDAMELARLLHKLYSFPMPTIARVNGSAFGGALGLIACCDIAIANKEAKFAFTEVKLGIIPAVISPYVVSAIGHRQAKRLFLTGDSFDAEDAWRMGLFQTICNARKLDDEIEKELKLLLQAGPLAQRECKRLIQKLAGVSDDISEYTAELIAQIRTSEEGQEGLLAFLEKRKPKWIRS